MAIGHDEAEVVVGVLADEIDAPGARNKDGFPVAGCSRQKPVQLRERRASHSITPPNTSIETPVYRFVFTVVRGARVASDRPTAEKRAHQQEERTRRHS